MTHQHQQERMIAKSLSEIKLSESAKSADSIIDLDTLLQNDNGRKVFALFLKDLNNSSDNILTLYLICCCFQNNQRIEDRQRIKQILEKTYNACFIKNQLPQLNAELKQKLCESLQKTTYNETIFNAVKKELKCMLESDYYPKFLNSKIFHENRRLILSAIYPANSEADSAKPTWVIEFSVFTKWFFGKGELASCDGIQDLFYRQLVKFSI